VALLDQAEATFEVSNPTRKERQTVQLLPDESAGDTWNGRGVKSLRRASVMTGNCSHLVHDNPRENSVPDCSPLTF
jgi:hypothetical protein